MRAWKQPISIAHLAPIHVGTEVIIQGQLVTSCNQSQNEGDRCG